MSRQWHRPVMATGFGRSSPSSLDLSSCTRVTDFCPSSFKTAMRVPVALRTLLVSRWSASPLFDSSLWDPNSSSSTFTPVSCCSSRQQPDRKVLFSQNLTRPSHYSRTPSLVSWSLAPTSRSSFPTCVPPALSLHGLALSQYAAWCVETFIMAPHHSASVHTHHVESEGARQCSCWPASHDPSRVAHNLVRPRLVLACLGRDLINQRLRFLDEMPWRRQCGATLFVRLEPCEDMTRSR